VEGVEGDAFIDVVTAVEVDVFIEEEGDV